MMKKLFLIINFLALSSIELTSLPVQAAVDNDELHDVMQQSKVLIDNAKKRGLSHAEIIEQLDCVLEEAAFADHRSIQGKGANLQRLLWAASGAATMLTIGGLIWLISCLKNQEEGQNIQQQLNQNDSTNQNSQLQSTNQNQIHRISVNENMIDQSRVNDHEPSDRRSVRFNVEEGNTLVNTNNPVNPLPNNNQVNQPRRGVGRPRRNNNEENNNLQPTRRSARTRTQPDRLGDWF